ncbi:hypothetical protein [Burkholderia multivorans]|uniref:hypothetical protein n=1 Tax=Burkholderia multivorans TaxID=87883 RepID=UPI0013DFDCA0|nr:hypothetical protein [Burkholderia multivorans]MBU9621028.1 hypothetical protein [Burkholderia multivorans]NGM74998.1 hypothetical protein [Burkholderia multivorans]
MNSLEIASPHARKRVIKRFAIGYLILFAMPVVVFMVLLLHGLKIPDAAKGMLTGAAPFTALFVAMTYQFIKELRAAESTKSKDPEWSRFRKFLLHRMLDPGRPSGGL